MDRFTALLATLAPPWAGVRGGLGLGPWCYGGAMCCWTGQCAQHSDIAGPLHALTNQTPVKILLAILGRIILFIPKLPINCT